MHMRSHGGHWLCKPWRLHFLVWLTFGWLSGCGRVGVVLLGLSDAGVASVGSAEGGVAYTGGCDASSCMPAPPMRCDDLATVAPRAICGCGRSDDVDTDVDGIPDCIDFCPGVPDQGEDGACACAAAAQDADGDGAQNCVDRCPFDAAKQAPGMCGCGIPDQDSDSDGVPDCLDSCPEDPNKSMPGVCGCGHSELDTDLDGTPDCIDRCSGVAGATYQADRSCGQGYCRDTNKASTCVAGVETACIPGAPLSSTDSSCDGVDDDCDGNVDEEYSAVASACGVGACARTGTRSCSQGMVVDSCVAGSPLASDDAICDAVDSDCDGLVDEDVMPVSSSCAMGACAATGSIACVNGQLVDSCQADAPISTTDATCNNVDDNCNGVVDEDFTPTSTSCGLGACARTGTLTCSNGMTRDSCVAPAPSTTTDASCNGVDDDCDGSIDEEYAASSTSCGQGVCAATGTNMCSGGAVMDSCSPGSPASSVDDATVPGNGLDDDCDGQVDEDLPACDTTPLVYEAGAYTLTLPGNCRRVTVRLWGGGGGGGRNSGLAGGGEGGPGGYASASVLVATPLQLFVGAGGSNNCDTAGKNAGSSSYDGGSGGTNTGADGADGVVSGGGGGGVPSTGYRGGSGYYGGGGGGEGRGGLGAPGAGGGGGAASLLIVDGVIAVVAGGGGGGGGADSLSLLGTIAVPGGRGGSGCRGNGQAPNANGGGGGGGGTCSGASTQAGYGTTPAQSGDIPSGRARGGAANCGGGGAGYAIVTFSPS